MDIKTVPALGTLLLLGGMLLADVYNRRTVVTFSEPGHGRRCSRGDTRTWHIRAQVGR